MPPLCHKAVAERSYFVRGVPQLASRWRRLSRRPPSRHRRVTSDGGLVLVRELLAAVGREPSDAAAVRGDAGPDRAATDTDGIAKAVEPGNRSRVKKGRRGVSDKTGRESGDQQFGARIGIVWTLF
jgi:hypothetical protein